MVPVLWIPPPLARTTRHPVGMVLKLAAGIPLVWRSPQSLQIGADAPLLVLPDTSTALERLLGALVSGVSPSGWLMLSRAAGLTPSESEALLTQLHNALEPSTAAPTRVRVVGARPLAEEVRAQIADARGLELATDDRPDLVLLTSDWVVAPEDHGTWLRRDVPHLPIVTSDDGTAVGPFIEPGRGPCLYCLHRHRVDADPAWPAIAAQLWGRPPPPQPRADTAAIAAFTTARVMEWAERGQPPQVWRVRGARGEISATSVRQHPECSCAALPENGSAPDYARETLPVTTSGSTAAVPA